MLRWSWKIIALGSSTALLALLVACNVTAQTVSCAPVGYWKFNEGSGTAANDASPGLHHGTLLGAVGLPAWAAGKIGAGSLNFDGSPANLHRVNVPHHADFNITGALTLTAWVQRVINGTLDAVITKTNGSTQFDWQMYLSATNRITFYVDSPPTAATGTSNTNLTANVWQFVSVRRNAGALTFFLDGVTDGTGTVGATALQARTIPVLIGGDGLANDSMHGYIDDPRIYPCALTDSDINTTLFTFTEVAPPSATRRITISTLQGPRPWQRAGKYRRTSILPWLHLLGLLGKETPAW